MLLPPDLPREHYVRLSRGSRGGPAQEAAALGLGLLLPEGPVPLRGRGERPELRQEGHICQEVRVPPQQKKGTISRLLSRFFSCSQVSVLRGQVVTVNGEGIIGVRVSVKGAASANYGFTLTRPGGW